MATKIHRRCPACVEFDDLISAGAVGLIQTVDRFQPERGYQLKTLAEHRIRGAILDYRSSRAIAKRCVVLSQATGASDVKRQKRMSIHGNLLLVLVTPGVIILPKECSMLHDAD